MQNPTAEPARHAKTGFARALLVVAACVATCSWLGGGEGWIAAPGDDGDRSEVKKDRKDTGDPSSRDSRARERMEEWRKRFGDRRPGQRPGERPDGERGDRDGERPSGKPGGTPSSKPGGAHGGKKMFPSAADFLRGAIAVLKDLRPDLKDQIEKDPERFRSLMRKYMQSSKIRRLVYLKHHDPKSYELAMADIRLAQQMSMLSHGYRKAIKEKDNSKAEALKSQIRALLAEQFEKRLQMREMELVKLEKRIESMREGLDKVRSNRDAAINASLTSVLSGKHSSGLGDDDHKGHRPGMKRPRSGGDRPGDRPSGRPGDRPGGERGGERGDKPRPDAE